MGHGISAHGRHGSGSFEAKLRAKARQKRLEKQRLAEEARIRAAANSRIRVIPQETAGKAPVWASLPESLLNQPDPGTGLEYPEMANTDGFTPSYKTAQGEIEDEVARELRIVEELFAEAERKAKESAHESPAQEQTTDTIDWDAPVIWSKPKESKTAQEEIEDAVAQELETVNNLFAAAESKTEETAKECPAAEQTTDTIDWDAPVIWSKPKESKTAQEEIEDAVAQELETVNNLFAAAESKGEEPAQESSAQEQATDTIDWDAPVIWDKPKENKPAQKSKGFWGTIKGFFGSDSPEETEKPKSRIRVLTDEEVKESGLDVQPPITYDPIYNSPQQQTQIIYQDELSAADEIVNNNPQDIESYINRAIAKSNNYNPCGALSDLQYALSLDPGNQRIEKLISMIQEDIEGIPAFDENLDEIQPEEVFDIELEPEESNEPNVMFEFVQQGNAGVLKPKK